PSPHSASSSATYTSSPGHSGGRTHAGLAGSTTHSTEGDPTMGESTTVELAVNFVRAILVAVITAGAGGGGWLAWRAKRKADAEKVARSTAQADLQHRSDRIKELRLMSDYCHVLRAGYVDLGSTPP